MNFPITIRLETFADIARIRSVTERAFAGRWYASGTEQHIIDVLRAQNALTVSLVAEAGGLVVGHVAFSPATPEDGSPGWYALGPVSVDPDLQLRGIGKRLIAHGIQSLVELGASGCVLIGDTSYYSKFGFVLSPHLAPPNYPKDHFMVLPLGSSALNSIVTFHSAFDAPE